MTRHSVMVSLALLAFAATSIPVNLNPAQAAPVVLPDFSYEDFEYVGIALAKYGYDWKGGTSDLPPEDFECPEERPIPAVLGDPTRFSNQQYLDFVRAVLALMEGRNQVAMIGDITPTTDAVYIACVNWEDVVVTYGNLETDLQQIRDDMERVKRDLQREIAAAKKAGDDAQDAADDAQTYAEGLGLEFDAHVRTHPTFDLMVGAIGGFTSSPEYLEPSIGGTVALRLGHPVVGAQGTLVLGATPAGFHPGTDDADILLGVSGAVSLRFSPYRSVCFGISAGAGFEEFVATPGYDTARSIHGILTPELRFGWTDDKVNFVVAVPIKVGGSFLDSSPTRATSPMIGVGLTLGARFIVF